jgi:hypothetical protein
MKKDFEILITLFVVSLFIIMIFSAATPISHTVKTPVERTVVTDSLSAIPDSINLFLTRSCTPCHSGKNIMASSHLDISKWAEYTPKEQGEKRAAICENITSGDMPPRSVRNSKPEMIPTESQIAMICKWVNSLIIK